MKQSHAFLQGEGAAWFKRNQTKLTDVKADPVMEALKQYNIKPKSVLEVGCSNGWRLARLEQYYECTAQGVDPCYESNLGHSLAQVWAGTADNLFYQDANEFDLVIYGWCLYLCDQQDYFQIAMEGDRVLQDGGFLIIYDFCSEYPYKVTYKHKKGLFSHHYDFSKLWLSHPAYSMYGRTVQDETCVTILKKNLKNAFPVER